MVAVARAEPSLRRAELRALPAPARGDLTLATEAWQRSLDAAQRAVEAADATFGAVGFHQRQRELTAERQATRDLLLRTARESGARSTPWLSPVPIEPRMLGLQTAVRACLFDLEGVLTDGGALHARAWAETFDPLLLRLSERVGRAFTPFDRVVDYRDFVDGRPRLDGISTFLASRGIRLPEGGPGDPADADTVHGLARRKGEQLVRCLARRGVVALPGARRYLEAARRAGLACTVVSASAATLPMLAAAELQRLIDDRADADLIAAERLRPRPATDLLVSACLRVGALPAETVTFTHTPAGIAAGRAAGLTVIGVGATLSGLGAERVVSSLADLLDPRLRA